MSFPVAGEARLSAFAQGPAALARECVQCCAEHTTEPPAARGWGALCPKQAPPGSGFPPSRLCTTMRLWPLGAPCGTVLAELRHVVGAMGSPLDRPDRFGKRYITCIVATYDFVCLRSRAAHCSDESLISLWLGAVCLNVKLLYCSKVSISC